MARGDRKDQEFWSDIFGWTNKCAYIYIYTPYFRYVYIYVCVYKYMNENKINAHTYKDQFLRDIDVKR